MYSIYTYVYSSNTSTRSNAIYVLLNTVIEEVLVITLRNIARLIENQLYGSTPIVIDDSPHRFSYEKEILIRYVHEYIGMIIQYTVDTIFFY